MKSGRAHGFLIAGLINEHLHTFVGELDEWEKANGAPEGYTSFCPKCCGPCLALADYFNTPRGRAEADAYVLELPKSPRPDHMYDWQLPSGKINWEIIEQDMAKGWCPHHEEDR